MKNEINETIQWILEINLVHAPTRVNYRYLRKSISYYFTITRPRC